MISKKDKVKKLVNPIPMSDAEAIKKKFFDEVRDSAERYGVDCYTLLMEFDAIGEGGKTGKWLSRQSNASFMLELNLLAWAYGELRGRVDSMINLVKENAFSHGAKQKLP